MNASKNIAIAVLIGLFIASFMVKLIRLDDPYFGGHIFRQLQTMSTIEAYTAEGINLLKPRTNYIGWPGYLLLEFPIFQAVAAIFSQLIGEPLVTTRLLNLLLAGITILFVYRLALLWFNRQTALYSSLFFAFSPLNILYQRSTLIDVSAVLLIISAHICLIKWLRKKKLKCLVLFFITGSLGILIKPLYFAIILTFYVVKLIADSQKVDLEKFLKKVMSYMTLNFVFICIGCIIIGWLTLSSKLSTGAKVADHLAWSALIQPKFYINIVWRTVTQYLNPFCFVFFLIGIWWVIRNYKFREEISLIFIPIAYYLLFPNINMPHTYYSLILIPYFSILAGCGAYWLETALVKGGVVNQPSGTRILIYLFSAFVSMVMFFSNISTALIFPDQRYSKIADEMRPVLKPYKYSAVFINPLAQFEYWEWMRNRPSVYLKNFVNDLKEGEIKQVDNDMPLVRSALLYALRQYGQMEYKDSFDQEYLKALQSEYNGELRYILFYLFDDKSEIYNKMTSFEKIHESKNWLVYDLGSRTQ